jgi:ABC-type uncharacterized transport system permease subunit
MKETEMADEAQNKYIVFKRSDWDEAIKEKLSTVADDLERLYAVPDGVVLRMQDVFAMQIFYQYANTLQTTAEILAAIGGDMLAEEVDDLQRTADRFVDFAVAAAEHETKLPD